MKNTIFKIAIGLFAVLFIIFLFFVWNPGKKIKNGVTIEGVSFSGYTKQEAEDRLGQIYKRTPKIRLIGQDNKAWEITHESIDVKYDIGTAVTNAVNVGRNGNAFNNFFNTLITMFKGYNVKISVSYNKEKLKTIIEKIGKDISNPGENASIIVEKNGNLKIIPERLGVKLDSIKTVQMVEENLVLCQEADIYLPVQVDLPKYTAEHLKEVNGEIGNGVTYFNINQANRASNIRNALKRINGIILFPGDVFSLNAVLGPRSEENGYKAAPVIVNDELVSGVGGGICQVATTLYNAVIKACLAVEERHHHTFPPSYVPIGQDATIAGEQIDFKFKNNKEYPVFISAENQNNKILIKMFSKKLLPNQKIKIESQVLEVEEAGPDEIVKESKLPIGVTKIMRTAKKGYTVSVYRNIYQDGIFVKRELISKDYYKPIRGIIGIGTGNGEAFNEAEDKKCFYDITDTGIEEPDNPPDSENKRRTGI